MGNSRGLKPRTTTAFFYRWVVWGILIVAFMVSFFHRFSPAVVQNLLTEEFALSAATFGTMASMYFYAYTMMQIPVGILADTLGPRVTVAVAMLFAGAGSILFGAAWSVRWLFIGRFLVGIGASTVFICIMKIQSQWFREREFSTVSGATTFLGNMGGILSQGPLASLLVLVSWRSGFIGIGICTLCIALLCWVFVRNRPEDMGFPPVNEREILRSSSGETGKVSVFQGVRSVLLCRGMAPVILFYFFNQAGFFSLMSTWSTPWLANTYGLSVPEASSLSAMLLFGVMVGGLLTGWIADRLKGRKGLMILLAALHFTTWLWILLPGPGGIPLRSLRIWLFLLGATSTGFVLAWSVAKDINSERYTGLAISVANAAGFLGTALWTSFMGIVIDGFSALPAAEAYRNALYLPAFAALLSVMLACFVPEERRKTTCSPEEGRARGHGD